VFSLISLCGFGVMIGAFVGFSYLVGELLFLPL